MKKQSHWADIYAEKIIREKGDKELYIAASGVTPSGTVHIGNFREIISVDLVVRAMRDRGKKVRFIYSWDDYDVFRKVPGNMPGQELLQQYLRKPITLTPDPEGKAASYARRNEQEVEELLPVVGIKPDYIYQAERYRASAYAEGIKKALEERETIRGILNEHRTSPLPDNWWPVSVFCNNCHKDTTRVADWDGAYGLSYSCTSCGHAESVDLRETPAVKLFWRVDWPMRWAHEKVDFEPAGKDHHSEGGSFDTAGRIAAEVFSFPAPTSFQYDFIGIKGRGGKISSSTGEVVSLKDVLKIYQPEVVRYLFASTRPNAEFAISFDLDVIKIYEDYDRCERIYYGKDTVSEKRLAKERRIYELSQVEPAFPEQIPVQIPFRHLGNLLQIHSGNEDAALLSLGLEGDQRLLTRARCAGHWLKHFAEESFRFSLRSPAAEALALTKTETEVLKRFKKEIERLETHDEKSLSEAIYSTAHEAGIEPTDLFKLTYRLLIDKEMGPRLAGFLLTIGKERLLSLFARY